MKAVVFHGTEDVRVESVDDPVIQSTTDAIVKVTLSAICGSDLHLYDGYNPTMKEGDILGHEFMGEVVEVGKDVNQIKVGNKVVIPFAISCGVCYFCKNHLWSLCSTTNPNSEILQKAYGYSTAALYGYSHMYGGIPGGQAEYVRVINADVNAYKVPKNIEDEKVLFLGDIFSTAYMAVVNALRGYDINTIAIFGCGPVGLHSIMCAKLLGVNRIIAIDKEPVRLNLALNLGAEIIDYSTDKDVVEKIKSITAFKGPDAVIDAVGMEATGHGIENIYDTVKQTLKLQTDRPIALRQAIQCCRPGGTVSIPGVYSGFVDTFPIGAAFGKGLEFRMGQTHVHAYINKLRDIVINGEADPSVIITHRLKLDDAAIGYKMFRDKTDECVKVVLKP